ncbi:MAG: DUF4402 domain-containing protein [Gemmatimonadota bacterium]|nr:DUF4402 domain-containing protein [Gemmatimonadota bacterium]MDH4350834.1 DUF4402 domain-containing protein [Gemmatimonadota bacterium]MDH5195966.1 DUF4402 domain-containing protein [Gemmatimonadota bacterium]
MKRTLLGLAVVLAAAAMLAAPASAQVTASDNIAVTGTVAGGLTVTGGNDLLFGIIIPGLARTIAPTDPGAGTFLVNGEPGASVQLTFPSLPTAIGNGTPADDIPLTLSLVYNTANNAATGTTIDPSVTTPTTSLEAVSGDLYIFLGGTVTPAAAQTPGGYTNTFTLQAAYVNN